MHYLDICGVSVQFYPREDIPQRERASHKSHFIRKIGVDAIDRVHLEEYVTRFKGMRTNRVRLMIVYRRKGETRELFLNDTKSHLTLLGKPTGKSSAIYDLRNYLNSCISKKKELTASRTC